MEERLTQDSLKREAYWTDSLAVGQQDFVARVSREYAGRCRFATSQAADSTWAVRETSAPYNAESGHKFSPDARQQRRRPRDSSSAENPFFSVALGGGGTTIASVVAPWWSYLSSYNRGAGYMGNPLVRF